MREVTLKDVLSRAHKTGDDDIVRIADLVTSHLDSLKESDSQYKEEEFHKNVKEVPLHSILFSNKSAEKNEHDLTNTNLTISVNLSKRYLINRQYSAKNLEWRSF